MILIKKGAKPHREEVFIYLGGGLVILIPAIALLYVSFKNAQSQPS